MIGPGVSGRGVRVAVLDTGIDLGHPDFQGAVDLTASANFARLSSDLDDRIYHGSHVAGIIAGRGTASSGRYAGIAPGATLIILKIASSVAGHEDTAAAAVEHAINAGADIINYSQGYGPRDRIGPPPWIWPGERSIIEDAFALAASRGILCIVAAGNDGPDPNSINRPGGLPEVLTVGAVDEEDSVFETSSRGPFLRLPSLRRGGVKRFEALLDRDPVRVPKPDVVAPGEMCAPRAKQGALVREGALLDPGDPDCVYLRDWGTSQATAVVSGLAACLLELTRRESIDLGPNPGAALRSIIMHGARKPAAGTVNDYGWGVLRWPIVLSTLADFADDPRFRDVVLNGPQLRLI